LGCLVLVLLPFTVTGLLWLDYQNYIASTVGNAPGEIVEILPGESADGIVDSLAARGLIERPYYAKLYLRLNNLQAQLKAGYFQLAAGLTVQELLDLLGTSPEERDIRVTFPEGWRVDQMADHLVETLGWSEEQIAGFFTPEVDGPAEGSYFPDTYFISQDTSPDDLRTRVRSRHTEVLRQIFEAHQDSADQLEQDLGLSSADFVIVASIVEAEATVDDEYAIVARVIYNRLAAGMRLQMDPTCAYLPEYRDVPLHEACHDPNNTYSTYEIDGLPPTPIGNPGQRALEAAAAPETDPAAQSYLYFVARQDGSRRHVFASTYAEHQANVARYLR